jgi:hypothetical protein
VTVADGDVERFIDKLLVMPDGCWEWQGAKANLGYGRFYFDGQSRPAHRFSWTWLKGSIPKGLDIDHLCRNTSCVNPTHLEPVTHRENLLRGDTIGARAAARTHCPKGHALDGLRGNGCRYCKTCARASYHRRKVLV